MFIWLLSEKGFAGRHVRQSASYLNPESFCCALMSVFCFKLSDTIFKMHLKSKWLLICMCACTCRREYAASFHCLVYLLANVMVAV